MPNPHRLPPLNSLRAFEAAARHQSVSRAAEELCVTHSAVSRHVAKLEDYLDARLFERRHQQVVLTKRGAAYAQRLQELFQQIQEETFRHFYAEPQRGLLRIGVLSTFALRFLIPRLARFKALCPDLTLRVQSAKQAANPADPEIDVAIVLTPSSAAGVINQTLFDEQLVPVASPALVQGQRVREPDDLAPFLLLHAEPRPDDWGLWLRTMGASRVDGKAGLHLEYSGLVYQAAVDGLGLAMAQTVFVQDDIDKQRLTRIIDRPVVSGRAYYVAHTEAKADEPRVVRFIQWLKDECARAFAATHPGARHAA